MTKAELKEAYEEVISILLKNGNLKFTFICNVIKRHKPDLLPDFKKRLTNMDQEDWSTTIHAMEEDALPDKKRLKKLAERGYPFWDCTEVDDRIKFLTKIINSL